MTTVLLKTMYLHIFNGLCGFWESPVNSPEWRLKKENGLDEEDISKYHHYVCL